LAPAPLVKSHYEEHTNWGLLIPGLTIFGVTYSMNALGAYVGGNGTAAIPVFGPITLAVQADQRNDKGTASLFIMDALVETTGLVLLGAGIFVKKRVQVWDAPQVAVLPTASPEGAGLAAVGRF
jgi:hypothetical protein